MRKAPPRRGRGRPVGGGISAAESKAAFLDAAERSFSSRGYRASTMEVIAHEAGYSRGNVYRHFESRERLLEALVQRTARRYIARILDRLPDGVDLIAIVVESMIIVASELVHDPLLKIVSEQFENQTVAQMVANDSALTQTVKTVAEEMMKGDAGKTFRPNIPPADVAQFLISTAISMLSGNIPGIEDPDTARRYIEVFVLPALVPNPPLPQAVFRDP